MSTKRLAIRGVAFNWLGACCTFAVAFVVAPILIHGLGNEAYGIWKIVAALGTSYLVADLGVRGAAVKYIAQFLATDDRPAIAKVMVTSIFLYAVLALVVVLVVAGVAVVLPWTIQTSTTSRSTLRWVVVLCGMSVSADILGRVFYASLAAAQRFDYCNAIDIGSDVLRASVMIAVVMSGGGLIGMACAVLSVTVLTQIITCVIALRSLGHLPLSLRHCELRTAKTLIRYGLPDLVQGIGRRVTKSAGTIIVGIVLGPAVVTFYAIAQGLSMKTTEFSKGIGRVLMPLSSQLNAQSRRSDLVRAFLLASRTLVGLGLGLAVVFIVLGGPLIDLWIGTGYAARAYPVLCILAVAMIVFISSIGAREMLRGVNQVRFLAKVGVLDVVLTLTLGVSLVKLLGLPGMAWAILVSQVVTGGVLIPAHACLVVGLPRYRFLREAVAPGVLAAIPALIAALAMRTWLPPSHIAHVVIEALCVGLITGISVFFLCLDKHLRMDVFRSFLRRQRTPISTRKGPLAENPAKPCE